MDRKVELQAAAQAIGTAALLLHAQVPLMEEFLKECRDMENFGSIINPTLYRDPERRAVSAVMEPLFKASITFVRTYNEHIKAAMEALAKVNNGR
jgi:hypothetical protein